MRTSERGQQTGTDSNRHPDVDGNHPEAEEQCQAGGPFVDEEKHAAGDGGDGANRSED